MAQFFTDFDEYTTGDVASTTPADFTVQAAGGGDWTQTITDLGSGDHALQVSRTVTAQAPNRIIWDAPGGPFSGDFEVYGFVSTANTSDINVPMGVCLIEESTGEAYALRSTTVGANWRLSRFGADGLSDGNIAAAVAFADPSDGSPWHMRVGRTGTTYYAKAWTGAVGDEPGSPQWSGTDALGSLTDLQPGFYAMDTSDVPIRCHRLGVGTGGDAAPTSDPAPAGGLVLPLSFQFTNTLVRR